MTETVKQLLLAVAALVGVTGCYPTLRTEQPKLDVRVRDETGRPVRDANVTFATYRYPFPNSTTTTLVTHQTDATGVVSIAKKRRWQVEILLPDGSAWYAWRFCVEKPGYRAFASAETGDFDGAVEVVLRESPVTSNCQWPGRNDAYYDVRVVE